jgi:hypothetical protein
MEERVEATAVGHDVSVARPRLKFLRLVKAAHPAILRITADISARCNGCGENIEASELACEVSFRAAPDLPDLRFHHRCYRTWCAVEGF